MGEALLSVRDLDVWFGAMRAVEGVSFDIAPGESVGIIGESGSGKSVTALACLGLLPRQAQASGGLDFEGQSLLDLPEKRLRHIRGRDIGFVFQDPMTTLHPLHRVGRQVAEAIEVHNPGLSRRAVTDRVIEAMTEVAIPEPERRLQQYPHELSGGLRQRVCLAIAIANSPRLLIADEPTTALDVTVQKRLIETLKTLIERRGMSLMLISHDLAIVHDLTSRVEIFLQGRIVESGPVDEVIATPKQDYTRTLVDAVPTLDPRRRRRIGQAVPADDTMPALVRAAPESRRETEPPGPALELYDVSKFYGNLPAAERGNTDHPQFVVRNVSLGIARGECHAIVGESGCGKSTLLKCISGILPHNGGRIRFNGQEVDAGRGLLPKGFRKEVQMVFQDPYASLHPRMRVFDIVAEPLRNLGFGRSTIEARVREAMEIAHLEPDARHRWPFEFSGGQRQRVGIARALVTRPRFLILDEPVSALDVSVQAGVLNLLNDIRARFDLTYLFISHDLGVVNYVADRVSVMKDGRIVETGSRLDVLGAPSHAFTKQLLAASPGKSFHDHIERGVTPINGRAPPATVA